VTTSVEQLEAHLALLLEAMLAFFRQTVPIMLMTWASRRRLFAEAARGKSARR